MAIIREFFFFEIFKRLLTISKENTVSLISFNAPLHKNLQTPYHIRSHPTIQQCYRISPDWSLEFILRPTVSRPVRLGIGPPFGILDQILSCSSSFV
jgi:hypothetical protein